MSNPANRFDQNTILGGVKRLILKPELLHKYKKSIHPKNFFETDTSQFAKGLRLILDLLLKHIGDKEALTYRSVQALIHLEYIDEKRADAMHVYGLMEVPSVTEASKDASCFELFTKYLQITAIARNAPDLLKEYNAGRPEDAAKFLSTMLAEVNEVKHPDETDFNMDDFDDILGGKKDHQDVVPFLLGCEHIDGAMGGFERQTLNVFFSTTNGGKSTMGHHLITRCIQMGKYVHITCVEDRPRSFLCKITSALTGINATRLRKQYHTLTTSELQLIEVAKKQISKYVKVDFVYGQGVEFVQRLKLEYDMECKAKDKPVPEVDIIDYTGHISRHSVGEKGHEKMRHAYGVRKDFALANNKICFDFAQVNREGMKNINGKSQHKESSVLTMADLAGSFDVSQVCDSMISINRSDEDRLNYTATLHIAKSRDGEAGGIFRVGTRFDIARYIMSDCVWENAPQELFKVLAKG
jgi:hypothetical protein